MNVKIETLMLTTQEALMATVFSVMVLLIYLIILAIAIKFTEKVHYVRKTANIVASLFIWIELVLGGFFNLFESKGLTYALIMAAIIAIVNAFEQD